MKRMGLCATNGKRKFSSRTMALSELRRMGATNSSNSRAYLCGRCGEWHVEKRVWEAYRCPFCGAWHVTTVKPCAVKKTTAMSGERSSP